MSQVEIIKDNGTRLYAHGVKLVAKPGDDILTTDSIVQNLDSSAEDKVPSQKAVKNGLGSAASDLANQLLEKLGVIDISDIVFDDDGVAFISDDLEDKFTEALMLFDSNKKYPKVSHTFGLWDDDTIYNYINQSYQASKGYAVECIYSTFGYFVTSIYDTYPSFQIIAFVLGKDSNFALVKVEE